MVSNLSNSNGNSNLIKSLFSNTACLAAFYSIVSSRAKLASSQEHTFGIVSELLPHEYCPSLPIRLTFYWDVPGKLCTQSLWNSTHSKHCLKWEQHQEKQNLETNPTEHSSSSQYYPKRINDTFCPHPSSISYLINSNISKVAHEFYSELFSLDIIKIVPIEDFIVAVASAGRVTYMKEP